jgi:DNA-binding transcriptional LysR family regulator
MITLKQLSHALALRQHGNFHRAARSANISQPAFSRSIGKLEEGLGVTLFSRQGGDVVPTVYGEALLDRAQLVLDETGEMLREIQLLQGLEAGGLSVAMGVFAAEIAANQALGELIRRHPGLNFHARLASWYEIADLVTSRAVDIGVGEISTLHREKQLQVEPVGRHDMVFFVRRDHPLLGRRRLTQRDIAIYPLASVRLPPRVAKHFPGRATLDAVTGELIPSVEVNNLVTVSTVVAASDAIGIGAPLQIESGLRRGEVVALPYRAAWMKLNYGVIHLRNRMVSPAVEEYVSLLRQIDTERGRRNAELMSELCGVGGGQRRTG